MAAEICKSMSDICRQSVVFLNPHSVVIADRDAQFRAAIDTATIRFCDGVGLSLASLLLNRRRVQRVYGYQFFLALSEAVSTRGAARVFFLGGVDGSIGALIAKYRVEYPGVAEIGWHCPPYRAHFDAAEIAALARMVLEFKADVLWVGLGSPKQEIFLQQLMPICGAKCGAAVGAVFDFYTNRVPHAPRWIRSIGLQWLHRLILEPRRLWRRTFISGSLFILRIMGAMLKPRPPFHGH